MNNYFKTTNNRMPEDVFPFDDRDRAQTGIAYHSALEVGRRKCQMLPAYDGGRRFTVVAYRRVHGYETDIVGENHDEKLEISVGMSRRKDFAVCQPRTVKA